MVIYLMVLKKTVIQIFGTIVPLPQMQTTRQLAKHSTCQLNQDKERALKQFNLFWSSKPIIWHCKTYHFANQNKLFCSSDVSDDMKKFVTLANV